MDVFSVSQKYREVDPCFITKLACNTEVVGALVSSLESYVRIFQKDLSLRTTLTCSSDVTDLCFFQTDNNGLVGGTRDGTVKIWDIRTQAPVRSISIGDDEILSIAVGANDTLIASAIGNHVVVTDVRMEKTLHRLDDHTDLVTAVDFHPIRDQLLASTAEDGLCVIRTMENVQDIQPFVIGDAARSFTFAGPDRSLMCFLGSTEDVTTFSLGDEDFGTKTIASECLRETPLLRDGDSGGYAVAVFYEDWVDKVLTLGGSTSGHLLLFEGNTVRASFAQHHHAVVRSALSLDSRIWTCGEDGMVALWECAKKDSMQLQATMHRQTRKHIRSAPY